MTTLFDLRLAAGLIALAVLGAVVGARSQLRFLMGLYFAAAGTPMTHGYVAPLLAKAAMVPPDSLILKVVAAALLAFLFFLLGVLAFERSPLHRDAGETPSWLDRAGGVVLMGAQGCGAAYLALCLLVLYDMPLGRYRGAVSEAVEGSASLKFAREHSVLGAGARLELTDPRERLRDEMARALKEISAMPDPSPQNKALAEAIKNGDAAALSKDPRFSKLMAMPGMEAVVNPGKRLDDLASQAK